MAGLFSRPKKASPVPMPKVADPPPLPQVGPEPSEYAMRNLKKKSGFRKSILTGSVEPEMQKKKILG
jgi:hypothetical protein